MIYFCAAANHTYTAQTFFSTWGLPLQSQVQILSYEQLALGDRFPGGVYLFTDFERLLGVELALVKRLYQQLSHHPQDYLLVNNPHRWLNRFDLLKRLAEAGINTFNAYRINERPKDLRFPVFLRRDHDHSGGRTELLTSEEALQQALRHLSLRNRLQRDHLMIVEYCNTADAQGIFRKYSAMKLNGKLIPRHILFSTYWVTKYQKCVTEEFVEEENRFLNEFPHYDEIDAVFQLAGIDYGRIDYGIKEGRLQIWEINTNPVIVPPEDKIAKERLPSQHQSAELILHAFKDLEQVSPQREGIYPFSRIEGLCWKGVQQVGQLYAPYRR